MNEDKECKHCGGSIHIIEDDLYVHYRDNGIFCVWDEQTTIAEPRETIEWWDEECIRVSGEMICPLCNKPYWKHESVDKEAPTLVRACDGRLLKI